MTLRIGSSPGGRHCASVALQLFLSAVYVCLLSPATFGQQAAGPQQLVRQAVANELASPFFTGNCTYQYHREVSGTEETRFMVKSSELVVGKLLRINGTPLSPDREQSEDRRLRELLDDPQKQERERRQQQRFEHQARALVEALPTAFRYTQMQFETGSHGQSLVHLQFQPAADFKPTTATLELLRAMTGSMVIDEAKKEIVRLEARLFRDVDFGWGVLVHVSKGGTLVLERDPSGQTVSNIRKLSLDVNGRILLVRKLEIHWSFDHFACFANNLSLRSAIAMLTTSNFAQMSRR
jgi:hypothetical protein